MFLDRSKQSKNYQPIQLIPASLSLLLKRAKATGMLTNLPKTYLNADSEGKRRLISSIYPENWTFDGELHRTVRLNEAIRVLDSLKGVFEGKKKGKSKDNFDLPTMVAGSRIELPTSGL